MTFNVKLLKRLLTSGWVRWGVSLLLLGILLYISDLQLIVNAIKRSDPGWLFAGFCVAMLLTVFGAIKWWVLMPRSRSAPIEFVRVNFISNFVGIFFPGIVGIEAARITGITRAAKDLPAAVASVFVDRVFGLLSLGTIVVVGGSFAHTVVPQQVTLLSIVCLILLVCLCAILMNFHSRKMMARLLPEKINYMLVKLYECLDLYRNRLGVLVVSAVLSLLFQLTRVFMVFLLCMSLGIVVPVLYLLVVVPVALFVQMLPISIYGIGVRESAMVALLAVAGVSTELALSLSLLLLGVQVAGAFPGGILFALGSRLENAKTSIK